MCSELRVWAGLAAALLPLCANADDTDIYINRTAPSGAEPMVMISLDYRANLMSTVCADVGDARCSAAAYFRATGLSSDLPPSGPLVLFDVLRLSLKTTLGQLDGLKVGLMLSHAHSANCAGNAGSAPAQTDARCSNGGTILMGFESLLPNDANGARARFARRLDALQALKTLPRSADHSYQGKELFFEFFRYLTGRAVYNGYNGWTDFERGSAVDRSSNMACDSPDPLKAQACYDAGIIADGRYVSPLSTAAACSRIFTVNFLFQVSQQDDDSDSAITADMPGINLAGSNNRFDTVLAYLHDHDLAAGIDGVQNVASYFIVPPHQISATTNGYARAGGSRRALPLAEEPEQLVETLRNVFRQILSVSTTFAAASVPVNVFNRATIVDNVYVALFQPDAQNRPFWPGNVKKLKLRESLLADGSRDAQLVDARDQPAVVADGRIAFDALTFWTDASALTDSDSDRQVHAGRDGRHVERGGAGQKIPGYLDAGFNLGNDEPGARRMFYDSDPGSLLPLDADTATATALREPLGIATTAQAQDLIEWIRGRDVDTPEAQAARPWLMGDPLHSRPLPINYGTLGGRHSANNPAIFIAVGGNDGLLRLIRNTAADGRELGEEVWAFLPQKTMGIQQRLRANDPDGSPAHPYGVDGSPVAYQDPTSGSVYLYAGLRRGGDAYYALDISDPLAPRLMWRIDAGTEGFGELGLTFSTPQLGRIRGADGARIPILVFAGGYDPKKDYENPATPDRKGRAIYVVDASSGALIWKAEHGASTGPAGPGRWQHADLLDSIAADSIAVDTDGDGLTDRVLVGDTGGRVWRADLAGDVAGWTLSLLADLGYHAGTGRADDRRFFHAADLVQSADAQGPYDAVLIGSGDRANPLDRNGSAPVNSFYLIKDRNVRPGSGTGLDRRHEALTDITAASCLIRASAADCGIDLARGWRLRLGEPGAGEKALAAPVTFGNTVFFTTYVPAAGTAADTCGPTEGGGRLYAVALADGAPALNFDRTDDEAGDPHDHPNSLADRSDRLASAGIPAEVVFLPIGDTGLSYLRPDLDIGTPPGSNRFRTFWRRAE